MLRQRKKQKEALLSNDPIGKFAIEERLKEKHNGADIQIRNNNNSDVKISNLVLQLIAPLMEKAKNFKEESNIAGLGVMAWNLGIIKASKGEKEMLKSLDNIGMLVPRLYKKLLLEYAEIKCIEFPEFDNIIYDFEFTSVDSRNNNLSVTYKHNE